MIKVASSDLRTVLDLNIIESTKETRFELRFRNKSSVKEKNERENNKIFKVEDIFESRLVERSNRI